MKPAALLFALSSVAAPSVASPRGQRPLFGGVRICPMPSFEGGCWMAHNVVDNFCNELPNPVTERVGSVLPPEGLICDFFDDHLCGAEAKRFRVTHPGLMDLSHVVIDESGTLHNFRDNIFSMKCNNTHELFPDVAPAAKRSVPADGYGGSAAGYYGDDDDDDHPLDSTGYDGDDDTDEELGETSTEDSRDEPTEENTDYVTERSADVSSDRSTSKLTRREEDPEQTPREGEQTEEETESEGEGEWTEEEEEEEMPPLVEYEEEEEMPPLVEYEDEDE